MKNKARLLIALTILFLSTGSAFAAKNRFSLEMPHPRVPESIVVEAVPPPDPPQTHVLCAADLPCTTTANNTHTGIETFSGSIVVGGGTPQTGTQGADTHLMTAGTVSGVGATVCVDTNGGLTTLGCAIVNAAAYPGSDPGAQILAAQTALGGTLGTIIVPDSIAGTLWTTTVTLGSTINLFFPGSATFTGCNMISAGQFSHIELSNVTLKLSGTTCTAIKQANVSISQVGQTFEIRDGQIWCNGQIGATGVYVGNHATTRMYNTSITGCYDPTSNSTNPTGALVLYGTQFGSFYSLHLYGNYVGVKIYSVGSSGGGNSNHFYDLVPVGYGATDSRTVVGVLMAVLGTLTQGANYFDNFTPLSNSVAGMASFGANASQSTVYIEGGSPEMDSAGASTVTIDGFTVKRSSTYINYTYLYWHHVQVAEATETPVILGENHSQINLESPNGYGNASGAFTSTDATSTTSISGTNTVISGATFGNQTSPVTSVLNGTPATSGANQSSSLFPICGYLWNGASAQDCWNLQTLFGSGTNPTTSLQVTHSPSGGSGFAALDLSNVNQITVPGSGNPYINTTQWNAGSSTIVTNSTMTSIKNLSSTNCSSSASPAVCGSSSAGSVALPTGTNPTLVVNTTAVTANSQILMTVDESLGTKLSVTCNTSLSTLLNPVVTARTAGTSFTFTIGATIATNPACVSYTVIN